MVLKKIIGILLIIFGALGALFFLIVLFGVPDIISKIVTGFIVLFFLGQVFLGYYLIRTNSVHKTKNGTLPKMESPQKTESKTSPKIDSTQDLKENTPNIDIIIDNLEQKFTNINSSHKAYWIIFTFLTILGIFMIFFIPVSIVMAFVKVFGLNGPVAAVMILGSFILCFPFAYKFKSFNINNNPSLKDIYNYRIAQLLKQLRTHAKSVVKKGKFFYIFLNNGKLLKAQYKVDSSRLAKYAGKFATFVDKAPPGAYSVQIKGEINNLKNNICYMFSARKNDEDLNYKYGVFALKKIRYWYSILIGPDFENIKNEDNEIAQIKKALMFAIQDTNLKGELLIKNSQFKLIIYDNPKMIKNQNISYINYEPELSSVPIEQRYAYGISNIIEALNSLPKF